MEHNGYLFQKLATISLPFKFFFGHIYCLVEAIMSSPFISTKLPPRQSFSTGVHTKDPIMLKLVCSFNYSSVAETSAYMYKSPKQNSKDEMNM